MNITVYCGASFGNQDQFVKDTKQLGKYLAGQNYNLIYGAGSNGLMGALVDAYLSNNGPHVTGVIPKHFHNQNLSHSNLHQLIVTDNLAKRRQIEIELGDIFIALPGGFGTLDEITEVLTLIRQKHKQGIVVFFSSNHFYYHLEQFFKHMVSTSFLKQEDFDSIHFINHTKELNNIILKNKKES